MTTTDNMVAALVNASHDKRFATEAALFASEFMEQVPPHVFPPMTCDDTEYRRLMRQHLPHEFARLKNVRLAISFIRELRGSTTLRTAGWR